MTPIFSRRTVRVKAMQGLYAHHHQEAISESKATHFLWGSFAQDIEAVKEVHIQLLHALLGWADLDQKNVGYGLKTRHRSLKDSAWLKKILANTTFKTLQAKYPSFWDLNLLAIWYYENVQKMPTLQVYQSQSTVSPAMEVALIKKLFSEVIFVQGGITSYAHQNVIDWSPYENGFKTYIYRFIKQLHHENPAAFDLHTVLDFQPEKEFYKKLVTSTLDYLVDTNHEINQAAQNWKHHRIFLLDRILLQMALTEVKYLKSTPKAVAINEYVNLAKVYSTAKSYRFINGILDVLLPNT